MEYSAKVLEHFANPHNVGKIDDADGIGEVGNAKCGDIMKMYIKVKDDVITDVKFNTRLCLRNSHKLDCYGYDKGKAHKRSIKAHKQSRCGSS